MILKSGKVYTTVASKFLDAEYSIPLGKRVELLSRGDFKELELIVGVKEYIETAAHAIRRELEGEGVYLPMDFVDTVLWSETPKGDLGEIIYEIKSRQFFEAGKADLALAAITAVHDHWVRVNGEAFFAPNHQDEQFLFLRLELIGFEAAMKMYVFVEDILDVLGLKPTEQYLRRGYRAIQLAYQSLYGINDEALLVKHIRRADYPALSGSVATAMGDPEVARRLAGKVIDLNGNLSTW